MKELKVGILGFGGIARAHKNGYDILAKEKFPVRLVALCDIDENQFTKELEINIKGEKSKIEGLHCYTDLDEMLKNEELDTVDVCLPTYLHKEYVLKLLTAGYNVQSEKPMALTSADCIEMAKAAKASGKRLMIGQCLRFNCHYLAAKEVVDSGKYGKVLSMETERLSSLPRWGFEGWFRDDKRSGGCMLDMGIHDYDMVRFLFGEPDSVSAVGVSGETEFQWSHSRLFYKDGPVVSSTASWYEADGFGFSSTFRITMEKGTLVWDGRSPVTLYAGGEKKVLEYAPTDHMAEEIRFLADLVQNGGGNEKNTPESAANTVALVEALKESAKNGGAPVAFKPVI